MTANGAGAGIGTARALAGAAAGGTEADTTGSTSTVTGRGDGTMNTDTKTAMVALATSTGNAAATMAEARILVAGTAGTVGTVGTVGTLTEHLTSEQLVEVVGDILIATAHHRPYVSVRTDHLLGLVYTWADALHRLPEPGQIVVACDTCGVEHVRAHVRTQGWRCDETGDFCPAHVGRSA